MPPSVAEVLAKVSKPVEEAKFDYAERENTKNIDATSAELQEAEHARAEARKKISHAHFEEIHPKLLELEKPQLVQCILVIAKALTTKHTHPHHAAELHGIVKHHKLGKTGYEELVDEDGNKIIQKEDAQTLHTRDVHKHNS